MTVGVRTGTDEKKFSTETMGLVQANCLKNISYQSYICLKPYVFQPQQSFQQLLCHKRVLSTKL